MKKIITSFFLLTLIVSPFGTFAETPITTTTPAPIPTKVSNISEVQLKAKLNKIKIKQNKTKANLKANKAQVKVVIKKVKKNRAIKKAKIIKAKNAVRKISPTPTPTPTTTTVKTQ